MPVLTQDKPLLAKIAVGMGLPLVSYAFISYRAWLKLGPGGIPYNVFGWALNVSLHLIARTDTQVPAPYKPEDLSSIYGPSGTSSFLNGKSLPPRSGLRPHVPRTVVPQRQMTEQANPEMLEQMKRFLSALADLSPETIQLKLSGLEGPFQKALWLTDSLAIPEHLNGTKGEFFHPHGEGSSHAVLSLADSAKVIELGWAERHKLSGVKNILPWGYVIVYAPRNEKEFEVWKNIVVASARFVTAAGPAVRVPQ